MNIGSLERTGKRNEWTSLVPQYREYKAGTLPHRSMTALKKKEVN